MKLLNSKAGVTVLEGVIALGLLAVVTAGAFGVLLSAARKSTQPDMREEMVLAVEKAKDRLQVYINTAQDETAKNNLPDDLTRGLCTRYYEEEEEGDTNPLGIGEHNIKCMLPIICDASQGSASEFKYQVTLSPEDVPSRTSPNTNREGGKDRAAKLCSNDQCQATAETSMRTLQIKFTIKCNGYEL